MRLLFVTPFYKPAHVYGGPTRSISALCENLAMIGCDVTLYTTNANGNTNLEIEPVAPHDVNGVEVRYFPREWGGNYFYSPLLAEACRKTIGKFELMYVASNWGYPFLPACRSAYKAGIPYIVSPRAAFKRGPWIGKYLKKRTYHYLLERRWIQRAAALHYCTELERKDSGWLGLQPPAFVVPNSVDASEFEQSPPRGAFRKAWGIPDENQVVLFLGRIEPQKGLDVTLNSFASATVNHPKTLLVLAGPEEDGYMHPLKKMAGKLGLADRVLFTGFLDSKARLSALVDADVFILTSYSENFGIAAVEAMAAGLPVIVSDRVGIAEDLRRERAGVVVSMDPGAVAGELLRLLASPEERRELSRRALHMVNERYSPVNVAKAMLDEFERVLAGKRYIDHIRSCGLRS